MRSGEATEAVLAEINAWHGTSWRLGIALTGGFQSGAWSVVDATGRRAVLKWSDSLDWAPVVVAAAPVVEEARRAGWPTPAWLAHGRTSAGYAYQVQDHVDGTSAETVSHRWLDRVLPVLAIQQGLGRAPMRNWSGFDPQVVFDHDHQSRVLVRDSGPAGAALITMVDRLTHGHRDARLPDDDLVHGDFNPGNVLVGDDGSVSLIDVEAVGRGSRLHDLSTMMIYAGLWGEPDVLDRLLALGAELAAPGWLEISLCSVTVELLAFGVRHWPPADCAVACGAAARLLTASLGSR